MSDPKDKKEKSLHAEREERVLKFWRDRNIFDKSLEKNAKKRGLLGKKEFIFYEGPPTANAKPGIHHLEARAFKDVIPRYKTMQGYHVRRRGGWDTHGLPVELQVEKALGLKSKKEIEEYGVAAFNQKCKENVWQNVQEWQNFTERMGYWIDLKNPYITYKPGYIESVWNIMKTVDKKGLLYKDYKVVPWCPRCGTALSSHELAQGYEEVKDLAVTVKFKKIGEGSTEADPTFFLAWTTTPWTLPGNVALAINSNIDYVKIKKDSEFYILAKARLSIVEGKYEIVDTFKGEKLVGESYEPPYKFIKTALREQAKIDASFKVYAADFVTTTDGTGIVHTAVMYGQDDFELGTKYDLPKMHLVDEAGHFKPLTDFLTGKFVKDPETDVAIIKDLAGRGLLFAKEKYAHSYPFCWRCHTPLIYFARDSWYIRMSQLRDKLIAQNKKINWEPDYIKNGRFGEWLSEVKDWAISRERYWGTPLPIWICETCGEKKIVGSIEDISKPARNQYYLMRHGESENNVLDILNSDPSKKYSLTEKGRSQVMESANSLKENIDVIISSPFARTLETARLAAKALGYDENRIVVDDLVREMQFGELDGGPADNFSRLYEKREDFFTGNAKGVENRIAVKQRIRNFLEKMEKEHSGKKILVVSHDGPLWMMAAVANGMDMKKTLHIKPKGQVYIENGEIKKLEYKILPLNNEVELDLHRPYIDEVKLPCKKCSGAMSRVKEVMDVWFDSGAMPFAQDHYPFETKKIQYPADFISEAIDQTRGWFYTLHAIGNLMGKGRAYKNVVCLGHILDAEGKKMSKSLGNTIDPWLMMEKYGSDALRYWMYSVNQPGESKNFDERTVDEVVKKVFNLALNVVSFYKLYAGGKTEKVSNNILDLWIISRLNQLNSTVKKNLDKYKFLEPTRAIRDFIADLSQWYIRRSRDRFKEDGEDKDSALATTRYVMIELAKLMAPFAPFLADEIYREIGGDKESVHLEEWMRAGKIDKGLLTDMEKVRNLASKGLEARMSAKINVRQPLSVLRVKAEKLNDDLVELIKDEVNVKSVVFDNSIAKDVELDTNISSDLKEEGELRELIRKIQDLRKEKGLSVSDRARLVVSDDLKNLVSKFGDQIKKSTGLSSIDVGEKFDLKV